MEQREPRIAAVKPPYDDPTAEELGRWMPPSSPVEPLVLFRTLCRNLPLASAMLPLGSFQLSKRSTLTVRQRELVVLRTCARLGAEYEWGVHAVAYAAAAGLDEATINSTVHRASDAFSADDAVIVRFVDALIDMSNDIRGGGAVNTEAAFDDAHRLLGDERLLELTVLCGWYHSIAFVCRVAEVPDESWAARFPDEMSPT
jgi:4-carboxymuconolactone decarboxylase